MNRRQFLGSTGITLLATTVPALASNARQNTGRGSIGLCVLDTRCSVATLRSNALAGAPVCRLDGDVTSAWFEAIQPHMLRHRSPIAGITQEDALFCLQQLAADLRWRLRRCEDIRLGAAVATSGLACSRNAFAWTLAPTNGA